MRVIVHSGWLYHRLPLSSQEIELLMTTRGVEVFLRDDPYLLHPVRVRVRPSADERAPTRRRVHLDEVFVEICDVRKSLRRSLDQRGGMFDMLIPGKWDCNLGDQVRQ